MTTAVKDANLGTTSIAPSPVWEKLWSREVPAERDDALLARERGSPRWALIIDKLTRTLGRINGLRTIELGSGRGDLSALLAQLGANVTLLDANQKALAAAEQRFTRLKLHANFCSGDLLNLDTNLHNQFDVAISIGVIEHFKGEARSAAIRSHYDSLKPGGMAIISVPNAWCPPYRLWKKYLELRRCWPYGMEIPYSRRELARRAALTNFTDITVHGLGFYQSLSDQWARNVFHRQVDWMHDRSILDNQLGLMLLMFARHPLHKQWNNFPSEQSLLREQEENANHNREAINTEQTHD